MAEPAKIFNNVILGQFVLSGVPIQVYASGRFLTLTSTDDIEDPRIGFGMDEDGAMIQFSYPEVEFLSVQGNRVDIETYNKGMAAIHGGEDKAPADAEAPEEEEEKKEESFKGDWTSKKLNIKLGSLLEASQEEVDADIEGAEAAIDAAKAKEKAAKAALKNTIKKSKEKIKAAKAQPIEEDHGGYTFGTGDVIQNTNPGCVHFGSKGIVISQDGNMVRYTVTNGTPEDTYRPGDILTKSSDQLEVYKLNERLNSSQEKKVLAALQDYVKKYKPKDGEVTEIADMLAQMTRLPVDKVQDYLLKLSGGDEIMIFEKNV